MGYQRKDPCGPLTVKNTNEVVELDKRTYVPVIVSSECPGCGATVSVDYAEGSNHLSHPRTNKPIDLAFYHQCGDDTQTEWSHKVIVRVTLEEHASEALSERAPGS